MTCDVGVAFVWIVGEVRSHRPGHEVPAKDVAATKSLNISSLPVHIEMRRKVDEVMMGNVDDFQSKRGPRNMVEVNNKLTRASIVIVMLSYTVANANASCKFISVCWRCVARCVALVVMCKRRVPKIIRGRRDDE